MHQEEVRLLGVAALEGSAAALGHFGSQKVGFLGLLPGDTGDGSNALFYGFRGPESTGLVPGSGFGLVSIKNVLCVL